MNQIMCPNFDDLDKLKNLLDEVLIPPYPSLGSMGGGSGAEMRLEQEWERKYNHRKDEYEKHRKIREQLSVLYQKEWIR